MNFVLQHWWPLTWRLVSLWLSSFKLQVLFIQTSAHVSSWPSMLWSVLLKDNLFCFSLKSEPFGSAALTSEILSQIPGLLPVSWSHEHVNKDMMMWFYQEIMRTMSSQRQCFLSSEPRSSLFYMNVADRTGPPGQSALSSGFLFGCCTGNKLVVLNFTKSGKIKCNKTVRVLQLFEV